MHEEPQYTGEPTPTEIQFTTRRFSHSQDLLVASLSRSSQCSSVNDRKTNVVSCGRPSGCRRNETDQSPHCAVSRLTWHTAAGRTLAISQHDSNRHKRPGREQGKGDSPQHSQTFLVLRRTDTTVWQFGGKMSPKVSKALDLSGIAAQPWVLFNFSGCFSDTCFH